jgi:hypothetical protein
MQDASTSASTPALSTRRGRVCWQGWQIDLPRRWDPVKLEGDYAAGYALFADALRPRLGVRWSTPARRKFDAVVATKSALKQEVGQLAAEESKSFDMPAKSWDASTLYIEPAPPGRDVWVGYSRTSSRLLQVAYHAHRREHILAGMVLPTIVDLPNDRAMPWAVFDLSCVIPAEMKLTGQRLNAGDLGLTFADKRHEVSVRQIAVAKLALQRLSLDEWIADQQRTTSRYHRAAGATSDVNVLVGGRNISGRRARMRRRRRFFLMWSRPAEYVTYALHDTQRDRIVIVHGTDEPLVREIAATVGQ